MISENSHSKSEHETDHNPGSAGKYLANLLYLATILSVLGFIWKSIASLVRPMVVVMVLSMLTLAVAPVLYAPHCSAFVHPGKESNHEYAHKSLPNLRFDDVIRTSH